MAKYTIISDSKSYHHTSDSLEAAEYILSIGRNFARIDFAGYSTRSPSHNTYNRLMTAMANKDTKSIAYVLEIAYKEVLEGGFY